jgi:Sucrase/ferredoxin-like
MLIQHCIAAGLIHKQPKKAKHASDRTDTQPAASTSPATTAAATTAVAAVDSSATGSANSAATATAVVDEKVKKPRYKPLLLTACTEPSTGGPGTVDIMLYPDAVIYTVDSTSAALQSFVQTVLVAAVTAAADVQLPVRPVPWRNLVLVCTHANRDKRCGKAGPQVSFILNFMLNFMLVSL